MVKDIAKTSSSHESKCKFLHNLVLHLKPQYILELGTNLGLSAAYMHQGCPSANMHTVEGDPTLSQLSQALFDRQNMPNIQLFNLPFQTYLDSQEDYVQKVDFVYLDGNHTYEATLKYFKLIFNNQQEKKLMIFDDINWSKGMMQAWNEIKSEIKNGYVVETHQLGIIIVDPDHFPSQQIKYISWLKKPFSLGIFG